MMKRIAEMETLYNKTGDFSGKDFVYLIYSQFLDCIDEPTLKTFIQTVGEKEAKKITFRNNIKRAPYYVSQGDGDD